MSITGKRFSTTSERHQTPEIFKPFIEKIIKREGMSFIKNLNSIINSPQKMKKLSHKSRDLLIEMKAEGFALYQSLYRKNQLPENEKINIYLYTKNKNYYDNKACATTKEERRKELENTLKKIPISTEVSYRGIGGIAGVYNNIIKKGDVLYNDNFMSSSLNIEKAKDFSVSHHNKISIIFIIAGKSGRNITLYSLVKKSNEAEILFPPDTFFRVESITSNMTMMYVTLKEVHVDKGDNVEVKHMYYGTTMDFSV